MLRIVVRNPSDYETLSKLQFILARDIQVAVAPEEQIVAAADVFSRLCGVLEAHAKELQEHGDGGALHM